MAGKTKKIILAGTLGLILIAAFVGYRLYNKQHFSVDDATPAASLTAAALHKTFANDSVTAKVTFIGDETNHKVIEVNGQVADISTNQQQHTVIKLKTATEGAFINCEMEAVISNVKAGDWITVKGICNGYLFEADLGIPGDVNMNRCLIKK